MNQARITTQFSTCILFSILIIILLTNLTTADIIPSGDISPPYPGGLPDPWNITGDFIVGNTSNGGIEITNGSEVTNSTGFVGYYPTGSGIVTVTGQNSLWQNSSNFCVGYFGDGEMEISEGGNVTNTYGYIGYDTNSSGMVTVTGQNSLWENSAVLHVGYSGDGEILISNGGHVTNYSCYIGESPNPNCTGKVTVTGQNSLWENSYKLHVGYSGDGEMVISDGGHVTDTYGFIGYDPNSIGYVTVTGPNSLWESSNALFVGYSGEGEMVISDGGNVINAYGYIGYDPNSSGYVAVTGPNSLWQTSGGLYIGGSHDSSGGTGLLNISNGGTVEADSVRIWPNGTLSGDGILVSGSVLNSGTIKPGNSIGTLTIDGDLTMQPGSIYEVEVDNSGNSDLLSVTGDVNIEGGTVKAVSTQTISDSQQYTIIEANNVTGTFDTLDTALLDIDVTLFPDVSLGYGTDSVLLQINTKRFDDPGIVQTDNQIALGRALQQIAGGGGNSITTALQNLQSADQLRDAYNQLCGQTRPQLTPVTAADTSKFMGIVSNRLNYASENLSYYGSGSGPLFAMAEPDTTSENISMYDTRPDFAIGNGTTSFGDRKWGFWGQGYGAFGDRKTEAGVDGYQYTIYGTSFGLDYQITDRSILGVTAGYSFSDVDSSLAGNKSDITGKHIGIYGNKNTDKWHFDSIFTYSFLEYETERTVSLMGEKLKGDFDGTGISGYVEARYDWQNHYSWFLQPLASFQFSYLNLDSYTESGGVSSLGYDDQSYNSYKGSLGMKVTKELFRRADNRSGHIQLQGRWIHEFGDDNSNVDAHFLSDPGVVFKVGDEDIARDSFVLGAGYNAVLRRHTSLLLGYNAHLNNDDNMHVLSAMLAYRW